MRGRSSRVSERGRHLHRPGASAEAGVPEDCPSGWVPVGVTGACAPATTDSQSYPDTNGPDDPCPAGTNWVEPDGCVGGDY